MRLSNAFVLLTAIQVATASADIHTRTTQLRQTSDAALNRMLGKDIDSKLESAKSEITDVENKIQAAIDTLVTEADEETLKECEDLKAQLSELKGLKRAAMESLRNTWDAFKAQMSEIKAVIRDAMKDRDVESLEIALKELETVKTVLPVLEGATDKVNRETQAVEAMKLKWATWDVSRGLIWRHRREILS